MYTIGDRDKKSAMIEDMLTRLYRALVALDISSFTVLLGLIIIVVIFQLANHNFLSPLNLTNLMVQISSIGILSVGVILVLLIGEIDLSVGAVSGITAAIMAVLSVTLGIPSIVAILVAILSGLIIGAIQGFIIAKIHVPAFIVTLAGLLFWQGGQIYVLGSRGTLNLRDPLLNSIANGLVPPWLGWLLGISVVLLVVFGSYRARTQRSRSGLTAQPISIMIGRLVLISAVILGAVGLIDLDRNPRAIGQPIQGVPMAAVFFIGFVVVFYYITH